MIQHIFANITVNTFHRNLCAFCMLVFMCTFSLQAQKTKKKIENPFAKQARELVIDGTEYMEQREGIVDIDAFAKAESSLRTAISLDPASVPAKYNAGTNYYDNKKWEESTQTLVKAAEIAQSKTEKHKANHNLGNALFQQKNFEGAVEAYKNALRANPTDEETRYNLALAKKEKEKNGGGGGGGDDDDKKEDKDQKEDQEKNEKDNKGDGDQKESDDGEEKETDDKGKEKEGDGEQEEDENGKPEDKEKEQGGDKGEEKPPEPQKQSPKQGQLSPQQVRNLLEAMQNEEQKTQEKINARKTKGAKIKTEKDW